MFLTVQCEVFFKNPLLYCHLKHELENKIMKLLTLKKLSLAISLCTLSLSAWSGELQTRKAVLGDNDEVSAEVIFNTPETGDMYLAAMMNGQPLFLSQEAGWTELPKPFIANDTFEGEYPLFSVSARLLTPGTYRLYQVVTVPQGNPFNVSDWIGGFAGLNSINFSVGLQREVHGDHDGDGFADDDLDRDGFHDDDHDRDGFHDDDHDRDGYHDDDHDRDGYHDDDHDRDGYHDDDHDRDGYHDDDHDQEGYHDDDHDQEGYHDDDHDQEGYHDDDHDQEGYHDDGHDQEGYDDDDHDQEGYDDDGRADDD
jgi:hypothetical protein